MFSEDKVKPANEKAKLLAECVIKLLKANNELEDAISRVPSYTSSMVRGGFLCERTRGLEQSCRRTLFCGFQQHVNGSLKQC